MSTTSMPVSGSEKTWLDRLMSLAAEVHPGEALSALLLAVNVFLLLAGYYILKPVREALILGSGPHGAEIASYSGAIQAGLLLFIIPAYGAFASKVSRIRLINGVSLFFISNLVLFFILSKAGAPLGIAFFLWVGIFNVMLVAQFWSFANDLYTPEEGKRLFAIVGIGSTLGAIAGTRVTGMLVKSLSVYQLMLVVAGMLLLALLLTNLIHIREKDRNHNVVKRQQADQPLTKEGGFHLVLRYRYLLFIGLLTLIIQMINTNGEYILRRSIAEMASQKVTGTAGELSKEQIIASYYANYQFWQNLLAALLQMFLVARILKYLGVSWSLFIPPIISLGGYTLIAAAPILSNIRIAKIFENGTDYSLENTVRQALFLPTSREVKYKAKQVVDSFFWRAGDMFSALLVFAGIRLLALGMVAAINAGLVFVWVLLAVGIAREHRKLHCLPYAAGSQSIYQLS